MGENKSKGNISLYTVYCKNGDVLPSPAFIYSYRLYMMISPFMRCHLMSVIEYFLRKKLIFSSYRNCLMRIGKSKQCACTCMMKRVQQHIEHNLKSVFLFKMCMLRVKRCECFFVICFICFRSYLLEYVSHVLYKCENKSVSFYYNFVCDNENTTRIAFSITNISLEFRQIKYVYYTFCPLLLSFANSYSRCTELSNEIQHRMFEITGRQNGAQVVKQCIQT